MVAYQVGGFALNDELLLLQVLCGGKICQSSWSVRGVGKVNVERGGRGFAAGASDAP